MSENSPEILGKSLSAKSTEELEELLQAEMDPDKEMDVDLVYAIAVELNERTPEDIDVDAAWESFVHNHLPYEPMFQLEPEEADISVSTTQSSKQVSEGTTHTRPKWNRKRIIRIGLIAAALVFVLIGTVSASRFEFWNVITKWTSETLGLSFGEKKSANLEGNPEFATIINQLVVDRVTTALVPHYLPDGYKQAEFYSDGNQYVAVFENGVNTINLQIHNVTKSTGKQFEIDDGSSEKYTVSGIDHIISTNMGLYRAVWVNGEFECSLSNVPLREDLILMIDSIYSEE